MADQTPTFVAKKIGAQYVLVPKNPPATPAGAALLMVGGAFVLTGLAKHGVRGLILAAAGGCMVYHAVCGHSLLTRLLCPHGRDRAAGDDPRQSPSFQNDVIPAKQAPLDEVDEASMESFPASDPPAKMTQASSV